jgi:two-component system OmpR family response regulator/two-component system response regulator RstA
MNSPSILLVEDDDRLAALVSEYLSQHDFKVTIENRGDTAVANFKPDTTDLVILDLMLPGLDGLGVCRQLREVYDGPIIMLTAKGGDIDQVVGLELGANDYVIKPVEPRVLLARVRAQLRGHTTQGNINDELKFGRLKVLRQAQQAYLGEEPIQLTTQEFELLWLLASHAGQVLSRDDIYKTLRGIEYDGMDRTVDVCISHLRKKLLEEATGPSGIKTVWAKGYLFVPDAWSSK